MFALKLFIRKTLVALALCATLLMLGCSVFKQNISDLGPTLADLGDAQLPENMEPVAVVSRAEIEAMYRSALAVAKDPELRQQIKVRLADIEMARSEDEQIASDGGGSFFG